MRNDSTIHSRVKIVLLPVFLSLVLVSCAVSDYSCSTTSCEVIPCGPGPEDFALDTLFKRERLIISSVDRRAEQPGQIQSLDLKTYEVINLDRKHEPESIFFNPHGLDLILHPDGKQYLYVISHEKERELVIKYQVESHHLNFINAFSHPLFKSLNGITADGHGGFYVTNDNVFSGNIVYCDSQMTCSFIKKGLLFANGLYLMDSILYVATTIGNKVHGLSLADNYKSRRITRVKGGDNFSSINSKLLLASHPSYFKFFRHVLKGSRKSPSRVFLIDPENNKKRLLFKDDGSAISASATALIYKNHLYISQVFEPYILKVKID